MNDRKVDLSAFKRYKINVIAKNENSWNEYGSSSVRRVKSYSIKQIEELLNSSTLASLQELSRNYYDKDGLYRRIILYYATLLTYSGLLIPIPSFGKTLSNNHRKKYFSALEYLENLNLPELLTRISITTLIYGSYYGIIQTLNKHQCTIIDLPPNYARSRFKDIYGNDIIEFDVSYFNSIMSESVRAEALDTYPTFISSYYKKYMKGKTDSSWIIVPADVGICFTFYDDGRPMFLDVIPSTIQYDDAVDTERERELEEIRKIIVQKIPHLADGQLLFEPDEAIEMHEGAVGMLKGNKNLSVLTSYADVDAIISKTAADNASTSLEKMLQNVYSNAGVSGQLFAPTGTQALPLSIKNDISLMMILGNKYARFISYLINTLFDSGNLSFKFLLLPLSEYTRSDFITDSLKLAQSGYSFLLPAMAGGLSQLELISIKDLENNILKMKDEVLIPLSSSYTESEGTGKVGAPEKKLEDKSRKTIQNEDSLDHQGQGGSE